MAAVAAVAATTAVAGSAIAAGPAQPSATTVDVQSWYVLVNRSSGKVLDDRAFATQDGAAVVQWARNGGTNQQWRFLDAGGGFYRLQNRHSGKVLDDAGWSTTPGTRLVQWRDVGGANQQFRLLPSAGGSVRLANRFSGMVVDVLRASAADGAPVGQWPDRNRANQQWQLVRVAAAGGQPAPGGSTSPSATSSPSAAPTTASPAPSSSAPSSSVPQPSATPSATSSSSAPGTAAGTRTFMGSSTVLVGGSMSLDSYSAAPFDVRYQYIHSRPAPTPAAYTAARCDPSWSSWWGCWTGPTTSPGTQVTYLQSLAAKATYQGRPRPQKYFWTWYSLRDLGDMAGYPDGPQEVKAVNRADLLTRYMDDYRFFLRQVGTAHDMIDLEPDFWGFARSLGDLHQVPAAVTAANPTDCGSQENSIAGLSRCLVAMARTYAPNAAVSVHLSCFDWQANLQKCRSDYLALGADKGDFLGTDVVDRDAGWYALPAHGSRNTFWTDQDAAAALGYWRTMSETVGKPVVLWQIPVGNMAQDNTPGHYKDDKVDWLFSHLDQVAGAHVAGLLFGAGWTEQTTPESDGGNLFRRTIAYRDAGGVALR